MSNRKQSSVTLGSGRFLLVAIFLAALMVSGAVTVQAQIWPGSFAPGAGSPIVNPVDHTALYLPYYDGPRVLDYICLNFSRYHCGRRYDSGYWYPWTFRWGRYDYPNTSWWTFGEGFFDEYGTGPIWMAGDPRKPTELKAIQTVEREMVATRMRNEASRMTRRSGMRSTGISASRGGSISSSGSSSSGGGSSGGGSFGGASGGGKK